MAYKSNKECPRISEEPQTIRHKSMIRSKSMAGSCNMMSIAKPGITDGLTPNGANEPTPAYLLPRELQQRPNAPPPYVPPPSYMRATGPKKLISKSYSSLSTAQQNS